MVVYFKPDGTDGTQRILNLDQFDGTLISNVKTKIYPFPNGAVKLVNPTRRYFSQKRQSEYIDQLLNGRRNGVFNSVFFSATIMTGRLSRILYFLEEKEIGQVY